MAVLDHHDVPVPDENHCALMFCLTWLGFFAVLGVGTYLVSML